MGRRRIWLTAVGVALLGAATAVALLGSSGSASSRELVAFAASDADTGGPVALAAAGRAGTTAATRTPDRLTVARAAESVGALTLLHLTKSSRSFNGNVKNLPQTGPVKQERPENEGPEGPAGTGSPAPSGLPHGPLAPAPSPIQNFDGLDFATWGAGHPPDTNGDVGPNNYIETVNTSIGIYSKTGVQQAAFTFNTFMSAGAFGNLCDTNNFGDPVVLYDSFEDRWIITDFAFTLVAGVVPLPTFQCFAVSKTGDPVAGGWNFYFVQIGDALADYPKFGIWPDGLYMTANLFGTGAISAGFVNSREWAFNKAQMYAGAASPQIVSFDAPRVDQNNGTVFTAVPSNARLQTGTPPAGTPNYFVTLGTYTNAISVWKFHVDWTNVYASTFTGATTPLTGSSWSAPPASVPSLGGNNLDTLATRTMMQNQYTNLSGVESLWNTHTVLGGAASTAAPRWYQTDVTGGVIAVNTTQAASHTPDTTTNRWMSALAIDRAGDMLLGYTAGNASMKPAIRWAGRLVGDGLNTLPQTETDVIAGTGTQVGNCGPSTCTRWGDYSAMSLDPADGCTFWYAQEYYAVDGLNDLTRIASTKYPSCTAIGNGTVSGTVKIFGTNPDGTRRSTLTPIQGATVTFGARTTTTAADGTYSFNNIPAGTYPTITASKPGFVSATNSSFSVPDGGTSTQNFALNLAGISGCLTDTSQADFSLGTPTKCDAVTSPGNLTLSNQNVDQFNLSNGGVGFGITATSWSGMTFTPAVNGQLTRADIGLFCSNGLCTGTPALTLSVRATSGGLPTGADLASTTIAGFSSGAGVIYSGVFGSPATLASGTQYALIIHPNSNPSSGNYDFTVSGNGTTGEDVYTGGTRVSSTTSGSTWASTTARDATFRTYMTTGAGTFVSGVKDSNPFTGYTPGWTTISWNATVPANTALSFQVAGSNNPNGPFNFVGPDGTAGTFFTVSGGSVPGGVTGFRYLKYKAYLSNTDNVSTPTISDVTVCYQNVNQNPTAVGVASFSAARAVGGVAVTWQTRTEARIAGFNVYRNGVKLNRALIPAKHAGQAVGAAYRFVDRTAARRVRYAYRLQVVAPNGKRSFALAAASAAR